MCVGVLLHVPLQVPTELLRTGSGREELWLIAIAKVIAVSCYDPQLVA